MSKTLRQAVEEYVDSLHASRVLRYDVQTPASREPALDAMEAFVQGVLDIYTPASITPEELRERAMHKVTAPSWYEGGGHP